MQVDNKTFMFVTIYKACRRMALTIQGVIDKAITIVVFLGNGVKYNSFRTTGIPYVMVARGGKCIIGDNFAMNNNVRGNPIGVFKSCCIMVDKGATLSISDNVGISQAALIAHGDITIERNVKIGGGSYIYTTDFHSISPVLRASSEDLKHKIVKPVVIKENAFIGAHTIILKGVTIGRNSIIGAGSIVTKCVPDNEIWAGNPAKFIKKIDYGVKSNSCTNDGTQPS